MAFDWTPYAQGGAAARPDSFSGFSDPFSQALASMLRDAPEDVRIGITSGYRSPETQERLWQEALAKYGSEAEARKWVAPPGKSQHNHGQAADLSYMSPAAQEWVRANAKQYGLAFPLDNEPWHVELSSARAQPANALGSSSAPNALSGPSRAAQFQPAASNPRLPNWLAQMARNSQMNAPPEITFEPLALPTRRAS